ncbi:DUF3857 domain-containing protein [Flexithrix dorotheae]|uniref:DUF3857 domain-containing protein n=1 Tax=Flexithrix dorotheae TaxID=70993 RepID=UPI00036A6ECA|nr:DUF3857 domain-containing protein [Flexithrix dorotheae]
MKIFTSGVPLPALLKISFTIFIFFLNLRNSIADNEIPEFGKITKEEISAKYYEEDKSAEAVYLYDIGNARFLYTGDQFQIIFDRRVRIQIFKKEGFEQANIELPYYVEGYSSKEEIKDIEAYTYNLEEDGAIRKYGIQENEIYNEQATEKWHIKKFTFPNIKEGSIIEYKYSVISPFIFNLNDWQFQYEIPVKWSEFFVKLPPFFEYMMTAKNVGNFHIKNQEEDRKRKEFRGYEYKDMNFRWVKKDVPAFNDESYITTRKDYLATMEFQLSRVTYPGQGTHKYLESWDKVAKDFLLLTDFGKNMGKKNSKKTVEELIRGCKTELEKARKIYDYVKANFKWNGKKRMIPENSTKHFLEKKEGNSADINLELHNMLSVAGLEVKPVLISTRDHGQINKNYPFIDRFNYPLVYTKAEGKEYLLDGTHNLLPFGMLPDYCMNGQGLILDKKQLLWANLDRGTSFNTGTIVSMRIDMEEQKILSTVKRKASGYAALYERGLLTQKSQTYNEELSALIMKDLVVKDLENIEAPLITTFKLEEEFDENPDMIYISPFMLDVIENNPLKAEKRTYPIDYGYRKNQKYQFSLAVPEGYEILEIPERKEFTLEDGSVSFSMVSQKDDISGVVQLISFFVIKQPLVGPEHYSKLREIYTQLISSQSSHIVLKKKK